MAKDHELWLRQRLRLPCGVPSHDTFGRVLIALKPAVFQACCEAWVRRLSSKDDDTDREIIAIDGKPLRGSHNSSTGPGPPCLVSAWSAPRGSSLGLLVAEEMSNETTAIPNLLDGIDVENAIATIDAAGSQKCIASVISLGGGDYVLTPKASRGGIYSTVINYVGIRIDDDFRPARTRNFAESVKGHVRKDEFVC